MSSSDSTHGSCQRVHGRQFRILLAEDDGELRRLITWSLQTEGYAVTECDSGHELLKLLRGYLAPDQGPDYRLIVSDIRMPGETGLKVLEEACVLDRFPPMILLRAFGSEELTEQARRLGLVAFGEKPWEIQELVAEVRQVAPILVAVSEHL